MSVCCFIRRSVEIKMEEEILGAVADLKNILTRLEKEKNYTLAQQATIELFKCYALLDNIQRNRDVICVDSGNLEIFDRIIEEIEADEMRKLYYEKELEEKKYNERYK